MAYQQREGRKSVTVDDSKTKWADYSDEEEGMEEPESRETTFSSQPDEDGMKIVTTYKTNESGEKVKITRKVKVTKKVVKINRNIARRRKWAKFGNCAGAPPGPEPNVTNVQNEPIKIDLKPRKRDDEVLPVLTTVEKPERKKCRYCGGEGHMTLACPKRREILVAGAAPESRVFGAGRGTTTAAPSSASTAPGSKYVPVHLRSTGRGARGTGTQMRDDSATIRVTNISEETNEDDLRELFRHYGRTNRIYLAKDRQTGRSRGFAFISYTTRQEAQKAIDALNDKGYDNLILHVEFAQPREDRDDKPPGSGAAPVIPRDRQLGSQLAYDQVGARGAKFDQYDERAF